MKPHLHVVFKVVKSSISSGMLSIRASDGDYPKNLITKNFKEGQEVVMVDKAYYESLISKLKSKSAPKQRPVKAKR